MKRNYKTELAGHNLTLSLSFSTSLDILDEVGSPSQILQDIIDTDTARRLGRVAPNGLRLNERLAAKILEIGNRDYQGKEFEEMGNLLFEHGLVQGYAVVVDYLTTMVSSHRSEEIEKTAEDGDESGASGNSNGQTL